MIFPWVSRKLYEVTRRALSEQEGRIAELRAQLDRGEHLDSDDGSIVEDQLKLTLSAIIATVLLALPTGAQISNPSIVPVSVAPSGSCSAALPLQEKTPDGTLYSCQNGTWGVAGGPPSSITLSGDVTGAANANTVVKVNDAAVPVSASSLGSNSSGQLINVAPQVSFTMLAAAGTSPPTPTCATGVNCTERAGVIFWGTGTGASSSGDMLEINMSNNGFLRTCDLSGIVAWSGNFSSGSTDQYHASTSSTTEAVLYVSSGVASSTSYVTEYLCQ